MKFASRLLALLMCGALSSCGGGVGETSALPPPRLPPAGPLKPSVMAVGVKRISLEWQAATGASHYIVSGRFSAAAPFQPLSGELVDTTFIVNLALHLLDKKNISLRVEACNSAGCVHEDVHGLELSLDAAIGRTAPGNQGSADMFGEAIASSGDGSIVVVGATGEAGDGHGDAPNNHAPGAGAVYAFSLQDGQLKQSAYLKAPDAGAGGAFGQSVALSVDGKTLVVGAPGAPDNDNPGLTLAGAAYVFTRANGQWKLDHRLKPATPRPQGGFGYTVAISSDGTRIAVGAARLASSTRGGVAIYDLVDGETPDRVWQRGLELEAIKDNDGFGGSGLALSADGRTLAVGAEFDGKAGAAHIFGLQGHSIHSLLAQLQAFLSPPPSMPDEIWSGTDDRFGAALALSAAGDVLAVGAPWDWRSLDGQVYPELPVASGGMRWIGAVHVYQRNAGHWTRQAYIKPAGFLTTGDGTTGFEGEFGRAVSLSADGTRLAVGHPGDSGTTGGVLPAPGPDSPDTQESGAVQMYRRTSTTWELQSVVKAPVPRFARLGSALALSADQSSLCVGAPVESTSSAATPPVTYPFAGWLYLF
jgi:hypothetical protein